MINNSTKSINMVVDGSVQGKLSLIQYISLFFLWQLKLRPLAVLHFYLHPVPDLE